MNEEVEKYRSVSLTLCEKLLYALEENREDTDYFFGGEIHKSYVSATDTAINEVKKVSAKLKNL